MANVAVSMDVWRLVIAVSAAVTASAMETALPDAIAMLRLSSAVCAASVLSLTSAESFVAAVMSPWSISTVAGRRRLVQDARSVTAPSTRDFSAALKVVAPLIAAVI